VPPTIVTTDRLDAAQLAAVGALVAALKQADGRDPLSDQALTQLSSQAVEHALATDGDRLTGYAQLAGESLEIAADAASAAALLDAFAGRPVEVWTHGAHSPLMSLLAERGFRVVRELHQLRRPLDAAIGRPALPPGIEVRPFAVGADEDDVLRVNAAAFAAYPDQGSWTRADIEAREQESWFDPSGFLIAWRGSDLVGFHWTKVHPDGAGEVYVLAVDPSTQGTGLGAALLQQGLVSLRDRGCPEVLLYVDGSNTRALHVYEKSGFHRHDLDRQWGSPGPAS
jgi:mycothiol synthase